MKYKMITILLYVFIFTISPLSLLSSLSSKEYKCDEKNKCSEFILNPKKIDIFLYTTAIITLLKSKAKSILKQDPKLISTEGVLYNQCLIEAQTAVHHAKCVAALLRARDELRKRTKLDTLHVSDNLFQKSIIDQDFIAEIDWITQLRKFVKQLVTNKTQKFNNKFEETQQTNKENSLIKIKKLSNQKQINAFEVNKNIKNFHNSVKHFHSIQNNITSFQNKKTLKNNVIKNLEKYFQKNTKETNQSILNENSHLKIDLLKKEFKRAVKSEKISNNLSNKEVNYKNVEKLKKIIDFCQMLDYCQNYMNEIGDSNSKYLNQFEESFEFSIQKPIEASMVDDLEKHLQNFTFENFPILSPKLFSLFSNENNLSKKKFRPSLLSPNMFSFHKEGIFSLPTLLKFISNDNDEMIGWLDLFLEVSNANKLLDKILNEINPKMHDLKVRLYPKIKKLKEYETRWNIVKKTLTQHQQNSLQDVNYAILNSNQLKILHDFRINVNDKKLINQIFRKKRSIKNNNEEILENDIYKIAELSDNLLDSNSKNATINLTFNITNKNNKKKFDDIKLLQPIFYINKLNDPIALNNVVLSPKAFVNAVLNPGFLTSNTLSPSAFMSSTLSPRAMLATILSPTAFTANILTPISMLGDVLSPKFFHTNIVSPRALSALVLSPRTMIAEVLSPKLIELRVLNPTSFFVAVLTPQLLTPRILSPSNFGVSVLSPGILSPTIMSNGNFTVQILSPSILSGELNINKILKS